MASSSSIAGSDRTWLPTDQLLRVPDTHLHHPQLLLISEADTRNHRRYSYLSWQVMHPPTAVAWSKGNSTIASPLDDHTTKDTTLKCTLPWYTQIPKTNRHPQSMYRSEAH